VKPHNETLGATDKKKPLECENETSELLPRRIFSPSKGRNMEREIAHRGREKRTTLVERHAGRKKGNCSR